MVRVIMGSDGAGKTKQLIDLINSAVTTEHGNVVCIERKQELTYDINYSIRLIAAVDYPIGTVESFKGFISGLYAGNYDISHIFVDNLCKIVGTSDVVAIEALLDWMDAFGEKNSIKFTTTMSMKQDLATDGIKKYM